MLDQVLSALIEALLSIPGVRFVMGLVDPRWRPLWAALWVAVIVYLISRTMNQLALRHARLRILAEPPDGVPRASAATYAGDGVVGPAPSPPESPPTVNPSVESHDVAQPKQPPATAALVASFGPLPLTMIAGGLVVAASILGTVAFATRPTPNAVLDTSAVAAADRTPSPEAAMDVRWRSGRDEEDDCVATFEVTRGAGTRVRFVAFVMDTGGAVMARDSAQVASAVTGLFVEFRFRHVSCDEIEGWQMQATTPKAPI